MAGRRGGAREKDEKKRLLRWTRSERGRPPGAVLAAFKVDPSLCQGEIDIQVGTTGLELLHQPGFCFFFNRSLEMDR